MEERGRIPVGPPVTNPLPSYWHNPKSPLTNKIDHEVVALTKPFDYVIIGSGISGTMIAYNLLKSDTNARVLMLEAREICSGATGRNGGHTKAASYRTYMQHVEELGKEEALRIARLEYANVIATHELAKELDIDCENKLCDTLDLIYDQQTFDKGKEAIQRLRDGATEEEKTNRKMAWYEINDITQDFKRDLLVAPKNSNSSIGKEEELVGVIKYLAGRIHAYRFTTGILEVCVKKGLQISTNTPVHSLRSPEHEDDLWEISTQSNVIRARNVVLATNGYTPYLEKSLQGIIVPLRGQITAQQPGIKSTLPSPLPTTYSFIYRNGYEYMIPRPVAGKEQHVIIGGGLGRLPNGGAEEFGVTDDSSLNLAISSYLRESLVGYFGATNWGESSEEDSSKRVVQEWTGIMGATADGQPLVGEMPGLRRLWISAGFNGHGMVLCLKSAEALNSMMESDRNHKMIEAPVWFPKSFLISEKRLQKCTFRGRMDLQD